MKREPRYFKIIETSSPKVGMLFGPDNINVNEITDGVPFEKKEMEVELRKNYFPNFILSSSCIRIVSPEMKQLMEEYITDKSAVEFFPVKVVSKEYGDRIHYGLHFTKIYDVLNPDCSWYVYGGEGRSITKPGIDKAKAEGLHLFNICTSTFGTIISDELRRAINRHKLNLGISFQELPCEYRKE